MRKDVLEIMQTKKDSKFVRNVMEHVWRDTLATKYFDPNPKKVNKDRLPGVTRTPLSPKKIQIVYGN